MDSNSRRAAPAHPAAAAARRPDVRYAAPHAARMIATCLALLVASATASARGGLHEPPGMQVVGPGVNTTATLPPLQPTVDAWGQTYWAGQLQWQGTPTLSVVTESQAPFVPARYYRVLFPPGLTGGDAPARWNLAGGFPQLGAPITRLYLSFWVRHSAAYQGSSKLLFFSQRDGNNHYLILANRVDEGYEAVIQNQGINFERVAALMPPLRQWNFVELLLEAGQAGVPSGRGSLWVNGALLLHKTDFTFFAAGVSATWDNLWMDPTYGGPAVANEWMDFGHVYVSVGTATGLLFDDGFETTPSP
jgi:hypothetical protein